MVTSALSKPAKLYMCTQNTGHTLQRRTHGAGCARPWFRTAEPLGERRYENWITTTAFRYLVKTHTEKQERDGSHTERNN